MQVYLRNEKMRNLELKNGEGAFRFYSEQGKRIATVQALISNPNEANADIRIKFY